MDLKDFVKNSITSIVDGIAEAQREVAAKGARLNPADRSMQSDSRPTLEVDPATRAYAHVDHLQFDVAVTTGETTGTEGGAGIRVWGVEMGGKMEGATNDQRVSRLQFRVPIVYPCHLDNKAQQDREAKRREENRQLYEGYGRNL